MNTRRNLHVQNTLLRLTTGTLAIRTLLPVDPPRTFARGAGRDHSEHAAETGLCHLSRAAACYAGLSLCPRLVAFAGTGTAYVLANKIDFAINSGVDLLECQFYLGLQVEATAGTPDGPTITLSGTVRYGDYGKGTIRVDVFDGDQSDRSLAQRPGVVAWADMESPGAFSVQLPVSKGKVWLSAFNDANGDGKPDHEDPGGQCQDNPMVVGNQDISGVVIDLQYNPKPADQ